MTHATQQSGQTMPGFRSARSRRRIPGARRAFAWNRLLRPRATAGCLLIALGTLPLTGAHAQQQTSFSYDSTTGFNGLSVYGDASNFSSPLQITAHAANGNNSYGAAYYPNAVDISSGFDTSFVLVDNGVRHFSFLLRGANETRPLITFNNGATNTNLNLDYGFNGMTNSVAVEFDLTPNAQTAYLDLPTTNGYILNGHDAGNAVASGPINPGAFSNSIHNIRIRYSALSGVLEVFTEGQLSLRAANFNFGAYGPQSTVYLGLVGANITYLTTSFNQSFGPMHVNSWQFGNNITPHFGPGIYLEPMTFTTTKQSFWNSNSDSVQWNSGQQFIAAGQVLQGNHSSSSGGFSAGFNYQFANTSANPPTGDQAGLRFLATANGGTMDVNYPLILSLTLPPQQSVLPGASFTINAAFTPDAGASLTTQSPAARFQAFLTLLTHSQAGFSLGFPFPFDFANINATLFDFGTSVNDVEFFDTDFIIQHAADFGFVQGQYENIVALKGDQGVGGDHTKTSGGSDTGSTKGSGKDSIPLDFLSLNMLIPNLGANGFLSLNPQTPSEVDGTGASDIIGVHADFTTALMDLSGLGDIFGPLLNTDIAYSIPGVPDTAYGWHIADLYGDLNLGMRLQHKLQPKPHLTLHFTDINNQPVGISDMVIDLDQNGNPITTPSITMPNQPLMITPTVEFDNTLDTAATLTLHGDLAFNIFQLYAQIAGLIDINAQILEPLFNGTADLYTVNVPTFQLGGFQPITGKPIVLTPASDPNPYVPQSSNPVIVTPAVQVSRLTNSPLVNLTTANVTASAEVILDYNTPAQTILPFVQVYVAPPNSVSFPLPASITAQRGTHTLTLVNTSGSLFGAPQFPITAGSISNTITLTVAELMPTLNTVSPPQVALTSPPSDRNGNALLQNDPNNPNAQFMTLTVNGSNFAPDATVRWNGQALPTQNLSSTQLTAQVSAANLASVGSALVTVFNGGPGGGSSQPQTVTIGNPVPALRQLGLSTSFAGAAATTTMIYGSNFTPNSRGLWNGQSRPTTYISSRQLEMQVNAADLAAPGQAQVSVDNGADTLNLNNGQELVSSSLAFTVGATPVRTVLQVTPTIAKADNGDYLVTLVIKNIGSTDATGLAVSSIYTVDGQRNRVAGQNSHGLPALLGSLKRGASVTVPGATRFPASIGADGNAKPLTVLGSFSQGSFSTTLRITLP
jgi:hypothetical protein